MSVIGLFWLGVAVKSCFYNAASYKSWLSTIMGGAVIYAVVG